MSLLSLANKFSACGWCGSNANSPNGAEDWLNCNIDSSGWQPPHVAVTDLVYADLDGNGPFSACSAYIDKFNSVGQQMNSTSQFLAYASLAELCSPTYSSRIFRNAGVYLQRGSYGKERRGWTHASHACQLSALGTEPEVGFSNLSDAQMLINTKLLGCRHESVGGRNYHQRVSVILGRKRRCHGRQLQRLVLGNDCRGCPRTEHLQPAAESGLP